MNKFNIIYDEYIQNMQEFLKNSDALRQQKFKTIEKANEKFLKSIQTSLTRGEYDENLSTGYVNSISTTHNRFPKSTLADITEDILQVQVKTEKKSDQSADSVFLGKEIKEEMPAPAWIPPKKKEKVETTTRITRSTRTKDCGMTGRNSDIIVEIPKIPFISISDTDDSDGEKSENLRRTRAKTQTIPFPQAVDDDADSNKEVSKKTKSVHHQESTGSPNEENYRSKRTKTLRKGKVPENALQVNRTTEVVKEKRTTITQNEKVDENIVRTTRTKTLQRNKDKGIDLKSQKNDTESKVLQSKAENHQLKSQQKMLRESEEKTTTNRGVKSKRRNISDEGASTYNKKSKSNSPIRNSGLNGTTLTEYEDARSSVGKSENTAQNTNNMLNVTYECKIPNTNEQLSQFDVKSDTESAPRKPKYDIFGSHTPALVEVDGSKANSIQQKNITSKPAKEIFSPYAKSTTKKKVEAFEKLQSAISVPKKNTAIKTSNVTPIAAKEQGKILTSADKFIPSNSGSSKISKLISHQYNAMSRENLIGMKKTQKELGDKHVKNQERELAQKKKEAMLQASSEAKKKLNEEKQLKVLQQRKMIEAEKQKLIEMQKMKEERLRQREAQREESALKQKLENERRLLAKKKLQETQMQTKANQEKRAPVYMTMQAPKLPTNDCYDSDDPDYKNVVPPSWCVGEAARMTQLIMLTAGGTIKNTLFSRHAQTPNLQDIFETIDPKKLKRSSSQLWRQPPRYTMMPELNDTKFSDDED
ncbi:inner centromere protein isoform X1 [Cylas formicarius]|uniref:inner centromere protein isoform X1 n=1 Tax=Cylas formicarius TaxID=197179 RepID=UPI002958C742|nr:inner centromere protein isoform X1 [Cylas formicarius]